MNLSKSKEREDKGKSLLTFPENYVVVDIETTGLSPEYDSIIEICALKYINRKFDSVYSSLINPGFSIDEFITSLTGITNEMLSDAPKIEDVIIDFANFIGDNIIVGHNVNFDINFIYDSFEFYLHKPLRNNFVDTLRFARRLHKDWAHNTLQNISNRYGFPYDGAHRAKFDCELTNSILEKFRKEFIEQYGVDAKPSIALSPYKNGRYVKASDIVTSKTEFDIDNPIYGKNIVITGSLEKMTRKEAMQLIADYGGINGDSVTKKTDYLILGNNDYCSSIKNGKSTKHKKAEQLKLSGQNIEILPENVFYDMLDECNKSTTENNSVATPISTQNINVINTDFEKQLLFHLQKIILSEELPKNSLYLYSNRSNKGSNKDIEMSKSICIHEPEYPLNPNSSSVIGKNYVILKLLQKNGAVELIIRKAQYQKIIPSFTDVIVKESGNGRNAEIHMLFNEKHPLLMDYITENVLYCLKHYRSSASFSCCSQFTACSDALKCLHENKLYATGCYYRRNLENGRIFYGKNKNID